MIDHAIFLLERLLMFFVHNNQAEFVKRQKQGRSRAHDDFRFFIHDRAVHAPAFFLRQIGMPFGRPAAESFGEPVQELHRERDLRKQDQNLLPTGNCFADRLKVGLRFP